MQVPLQITFHHVEPSPYIEKRIRDEVDRLERFHHRITSCHVVVEGPASRRHKGGVCDVRIHLGVPGGHIDVTREPGRDHRHEECYVAVHDAFARAARLLEDHVRERRGDVKTHASPDHGRVTRLLRDRDGGFLESSGDVEVYFHRNAIVSGDYDTMKVGDEVRFVLAPELGDDGAPQASTVRVIGKHHVVD